MEIVHINNEYPLDYLDAIYVLALTYVVNFS